MRPFLLKVFSLFLISSFLATGGNAQDNVGIGNTNPEAKLDIKGSSSDDSAAALRVTNADDNAILFLRNDGRLGIGTITPGARFMVVGQAGAPTMNILNDGNNPTAPALRVNENGRVGIGLTDPGAKFMVKGGGATNETVSLHIVNADNASLLHIKDDGNIGVGTTSPKTKVEVADGDIYINNANNGIILTAPNGNCYRVTVNMMGQLVSTPITCPN